MPNQCFTSHHYERSCGAASHPKVRYNQLQLAFEPMLGRFSIVVTDKLRLNIPVKQDFIFTSLEGLTFHKLLFIHIQSIGLLVRLMNTVQIKRILKVRGFECKQLRNRTMYE